MTARDAIRDALGEQAHRTTIAAHDQPVAIPWTQSSAGRRPSGEGGHAGLGKALSRMRRRSHCHRRARGGS